MIKVENIDIWGFEHAIRGMRNPMNSWAKSDSLFADPDRKNYHDILGNVKDCSDSCPIFSVSISDHDLALMKMLFKAGPEHRKYLRQIMVSMDITAPLYWWKEFDTYKVGTVANSCSTMHKIAEKEFTLDDFSHEYLNSNGVIDSNYKSNDWDAYGCLCHTIDVLNYFRERYLKTKDKLHWWQMIQLLPSSYNQKRTITMTYENVATIIRQRTGHKLDEWNNFVDILKGLPYVEAIMGDD